MFRKLVLILTALCLLLTGCAAPAPAASAAPAPAATAAPAEPATQAKPALSKDLAILYTNDVHCGVDDAIGYAGLSALRAQLKKDGCNVLLVDCGDAIQGAPIGTISKGEYPIEIMNQVGYDVAIPGNHEFDYGMDRFLELTEMAEFPYVSANFMDLSTSKTVFDPYVIKEVDGVKIAFVGVTTPRAITTSTPIYFQDASGNYIYGFCEDDTGAPLYAAVQSAVDAAREEGANYVILLSHLGIDSELSPWMSTEVIANTTGIDVVLDAHSHSVLECERVRNKDGAWTLLSSTGTKLERVGMLLMTADGNITTGNVSAISQKEAGVALFIKDIQSQFNELLNTVVAKSEVDLIINQPGTDVRIIRNAETNLGDLCADAYRVMGEADVAFVNGGGIRAAIKAGDVTYNDILTVHPFGNALCVVEASGQEILDALEMGAREVPAETGAFLQVSGLSYEINTKVKSTVKIDDKGMFQGVEGDRRVQNVLVGNAPLDPAKTYTVACHDYLLKNAGDGYTMFQDNVLLKDCIMLDNQVLINYITESLGGVIGEGYTEPFGQERIIAAE